MFPAKRKAEGGANVRMRADPIDMRANWDYLL